MVQLREEQARPQPQKMVVPGYSINHEGEVEQGVVTHRQQTRQRHLSSGMDEDIASSYFAAQFGGQQQKQQQKPQQQQQQQRKGGSKQGSQAGSRRGSVGLTTNNGVQTVIASAAALIAEKKKKEQEARQEEAKRLLQRREMTPDNLRHVEEKLIQLQKQRQQEEEEERAQSQQPEEIQNQQQQQQEQQQYQLQMQYQQQQQQQYQMQQQYQQQQQQQQQQYQQQCQQQAEQQQLPLERHLPPPPARTEAQRGSSSGRGESQSKEATSMQRTQSEDREAQNGQWAISSSTDYLNKRSKDFMVRNNPLGLAEPSVKRDGYAVGSREGSMYRSTGNLNVSSGVAGSRAGSESKDIPKGNWKERRASTSDLKGSGIRVGGNLVEPSAKPCMPFGSGGGGVVRRRQVNKSSQQQKTTRSSSTSRTSTTSTMQQVSTALEQIQVQESRSQVTVALPRGRSRAQSLPRGQVTNEESSFRVSLPASARNSRQASVEPEAQKKLTRHGSVEIYDGSYNLTVPNKQTRSASKTRLEQTKGDHIRIEAGDEENGGEEEAASPSPAPAAPSVQQTYAGPTTVEQTYDLPAPAAQQQQIVQQSSAVEQTSTSSSRCQTSIQQSSTTVQQTSVEQSSSSSVQQESFAIQQNAIQQSSTMHSSSSSQQQSSSCSVEQSIQQSSSQQSSSKVQSSLQQMSNQQSSSTQSVTQQQIVSQSAVQQQSSVQQTSVQQSSQQTIQQQSIQQNGKQRSRQASGTQDRDAVVQSGGKFNITQGLNRRSRHQSGNCEQRQGTSATPGSALRGLDTALEKIAAQQKKEETHTGSTTYVAKVSSRQSSRRQSVNATTGEEVTTVTLSLPPSQRGSRQTSRRGSVSEGGGARKSRRGSLDIYTAEYALKIGGGEKKGVTAMEQKTAFHMKVENESESEMALCGRCHLPTHKTKVCPEFGTLSCPRCLEWGHWEDACWTQDGEPHVCSRCDYEGHNEAVHDAEDFKQRRAVVDTLGWEPFQNWFYDQAFRGWWQVTGCVGVPLYRIYPRKTAWRTEKPEVTEDEPVAKSSLTRADSVDDMIAQVKLLSQRRPVVKKDSEEDSSGRSTPAHLR